MEPAVRRSLVVDGVRTSYLEAGAPGDTTAPVVVLLHGGAWGECAETAWLPTLAALAPTHHVLAPDWIGFGHSDKLRDFGDLPGRLLRQLTGLLAALDVRQADVVGLSMGGSVLLRGLTAPPGPEPRLPVRRAVLVSAGGAPIEPPVRAQLADYDGTVESMRRQVSLAFADPAFVADDAFVGARHEASLLPGAYEWFASLGLRAPGAKPPPAGDPTPYDRVQVPVLVVAGGRDALKPAGWAQDLLPRLPDGQLREFADAGHCPQLEAVDGFAEALRDFFDVPTAEGRA